MLRRVLENPGGLEKHPSPDAGIWVMGSNCTHFFSIFPGIDGLAWK
jgi:hypothetical protein